MLLPKIVQLTFAGNAKELINEIEGKRLFRGRNHRHLGTYVFTANYEQQMVENLKQKNS